MSQIISTSELLQKIASEHKRESISLKEIKDSLHERGFGILFIVFCLPLLIPLPLPTGLGTAMSVPIFFFSFQLIFAHNSPWLPNWVLRKELGIETFRKIMRKAAPTLRFIEKFLKERWMVVSDTRGFEIFIGVFILLLNIPICLPFPMSNTIPAISIIIISFGMLEKDGVMMIFGLIVGVIAWLVCIAIGFAIFYGANKLGHYLPDSFKHRAAELRQHYLAHPEDENYIPAADNDEDYSHIKAEHENIISNGAAEKDSDLIDTGGNIDENAGLGKKPAK